MTLTFLQCTVKMKGHFNPSWVISVASVHISIMAHIHSIFIHSLQCHILNILQYGSLPLLCINAYARGKTTGLGKYNARVLYITLHGTDPNAFISVVQCFGKGPGIIIIALYIPHSCNNRTNLFARKEGEPGNEASHTIANTINLHGELP